MERYIPSNDLKGIKQYTESLENSLRTTQTDGNFLTNKLSKLTLEPNILHEKHFINLTKVYNKETV